IGWPNKFISPQHYGVGPRFFLLRPIKIWQHLIACSHRLEPRLCKGCLGSLVCYLVCLFIFLDNISVQYSISFYLHYLSTWPEHMQVLESPTFTATALSPTDTVVHDVSTENGGSEWAYEISTATSGRLMGYMMAKSEGRGMDWHGHVTALSVAPEYRRLGLATQLMLDLEETSERQVELPSEVHYFCLLYRKRCYYVDLFVRASNKLGLEIYTKLGYVVYRRVLNYYWGSVEDEDAFDMRKALSTDVDKRSVIPLTRPNDCTQ
ncbi:acetyltransferase, GNAT family, partial [Opisthorchis viverrini]